MPQSVPICGAFFLALLSPAFAGAEAAPDFNREVRPILSHYCFKCHGPDEKARKAKLRLDLREHAVGPAKSGDPAIVPGDLAKSELLHRINSTDEDEQMPPPSTKKQLSAAQKETLRRWIAAGASYDAHWAFVKPTLVTPPKLPNQQLAIANPIDAFVRARLASEDLAPAPETDRATLIRRVSFDLIGLPPTPEELDAFRNDPAPDAYEKVVDRLLASPAYGERWARKWLDLSRYADTNGYEKDRERNIWPWRDWVIRALNSDLPFDQFTIEQLAGDLLPNATPDQIVATGFHRNTMLNEEGGIDPLEFRFHAMTDRMRTTGRTWLGLTIECAQCHTHKFDPITHREYYQFFAFLNNADEPDFDLPDPAAAAQQRANEQRAAKLLAELPNAWPLEEGTADGRPGEVRRREAVEKRFAEWLTRERARNITWTPLQPVAAKSNLPLLTVQRDGSVLASGDISKSDTYELTFRNAPRGVTAVRLEALPDERLPKHGPGLAYYEGPKGDFFMGEITLHADGAPVKFSQATESYAKNAMGGTPATAALAIDGDPQTGWSTSGREGEASEAVFQLAAPLSADELRFKMLFGRHYACSLGRFRISVTTDPRAAAAREIPEEIARLLAVPDTRLTAGERLKLREHFLLTAPELASATAEIKKLRKAAGRPTSLVFRERPAENPRPTFIHNRGEFLEPKERVEPGVPAILNPLPPGVRHDRLALARWLVAPENPLTARVTVNRAWMAFFGRGIVKTVDDFGYQGESPSHPELLDWLALEFVRQGWSMKKLHRMIVTSATYRQSSRTTPAVLARDPENRLLARGPRHRLEAEMIRDAALRIAGLLHEKIGGPSVRPPQPDGVTEVAYGGGKWNASTGPDRYRRSLYTFSKRTAPFALFTTFDAPSGDTCIAQRETSDTPLQALTTLNDVVFVEAAQAFGKMIAAQPGDDAARISALFRRAFSREPHDHERALAVRFLARQRERFSTKELDAVAVAGKDAAAESAAWTALARALFNTDEALTKG